MVYGETPYSVGQLVNVIGIDDTARNSVSVTRTKAPETRLRMHGSAAAALEYALVSSVSEPGDNKTSARARQKWNRLAVVTEVLRKAKAGLPSALLGDDAVD